MIFSCPYTCTVLTVQVGVPDLSDSTLWACEWSFVKKQSIFLPLLLTHLSEVADETFTERRFSGTRRPYHMALVDIAT